MSRIVAFGERAGFQPFSTRSKSDPRRKKFWGGSVVPFQRAHSSANAWRYLAFLPPGVSSYGAPVPVEPRNNLRPSAKVISLPFALREPSLDWYPSTTIFVPGSREFFVKPRRNKTFGVPASKAQFSTLPSGFFTST